MPVRVQPVQSAPAVLGVHLLCHAPCGVGPVRDAAVEDPAVDLVEFVVTPCDPRRDADTSGLFSELTMDELRAIAGYAVACAEPALVIFQKDRARSTVVGGHGFRDHTGYRRGR